MPMRRTLAGTVRRPRLGPAPLGRMPLVAPALLGCPPWWDAVADPKAGAVPDGVRRHALEQLHGDANAILAWTRPIITISSTGSKSSSLPWWGYWVRGYLVAWSSTGLNTTVRQLICLFMQRLRSILMAVERYG